MKLEQAHCVSHCAKILYQSRHIGNCLNRKFKANREIYLKSSGSELKMSVLNQSGEEQVECPLCMEPLEVDDLNFFPCTCGYQICRFCWHRIRLDENGGLCPACRKAYSENPADFIPLSQEEVAKLKAEKRQRDQQRKAKLTESRKHLASVRVVQRNLVFVVGLPPRLADPEILKRHEYFGKFGKIHKVVINQSTSYAGSQGPSASAYVTYMKSDDALRAIQAVNNVTIDNRLIKSSLGTTKYCSHFMKNQPCPKADCMYLHEYGDAEASFTKEQMHSGKHQEYEKKLHEELQLRTKQAAQTTNGSCSNSTAPGETKNGQQQGNSGIVGKGQKDGSATGNSGTSNGNSKDGGSNKENWPNLEKEKEKGRKGKTKNADGRKEKRDVNSGKSNSDGVKLQNKPTNNQSVKTESKDIEPDNSSGPSSEPTPSPSPPFPTAISSTTARSTGVISKVPSDRTVDDNTSFFSSGDVFQICSSLIEESTREKDDRDQDKGEDERPDDHGSKVFTDSLPAIRTTEDWAAAFGFAGQQNRDGQDVSQHKLQQREVSKLSAFGGFGPLGGQDNEFGKGIDSYSGFYEISKMQENLMDALANKTTPTDGLNVSKMNGFVGRHAEPPTTHVSNGLDHSMLKFMSDFHKTNANKEPQSPSPFQNGFNGINAYHQGLLLQQKHIEEQLMNLSLKHNYGDSQAAYENGYINGGLSSIHSLFNKKPQPVQTQQHQLNSRHSEAELDFDPFQETQKALAELMANEQNHKTHNNLGHSNQINGIIHNQNGSHIPPPPPGFLHQQQSSHMNSFGSKILPYLNMSSSQQINNSANSWPSSFNTQLQQQKNLVNTCNDWKVLDPAILSASSRNYQLGQMPHYPQQQQQQQQPIQNGGGPLRSYDYPAATAFSAYTAQLQPSTNFNTFTSHLNAHQNLWYNNELNSQISSPPGFRNSQTSKQQEC